MISTNGRAIPGGKVVPKRTTIAAEPAAPTPSSRPDRTMISEFFIDRPVLANVLAIVIVLIGGVALVTPADRAISQHRAADRPGDDAPIPGASATTVVDKVALPIELQVNGVEGMIYMQSTSTDAGTYSLTVTFEIGTDLDFAQVLVQNRVSAALASLPHRSRRRASRRRRSRPRCCRSCR